MEKVKLTFLGTGDAIPTKIRNHTGILVSFNKENILLDCGENMQRQFRIAGISPNDLTRIIITHWHGDHILGLPGLFQTLAMRDYKKTLKIYGPPGTKRGIALVQELVKQIRINLEVHEVSGKFIDEPTFFVEAASMQHGSTPTNAYSIKFKDKFRLDDKKINKFKLPHSPILKELQRGKDITVNGKKIKASQVGTIETGKKITLVLDTAYNEHAVKLAKDSDILITEATFLADSERGEELAKQYEHLTAQQAATIAKKAKAKKLIITHISQRYEANLNAVRDEAKKVFKNTQLVKDFDIVEL
ncbi:MAG: ribonuclease Z [archaeon]